MMHTNHPSLKIICNAVRLGLATNRIYAQCYGLIIGESGIPHFKNMFHDLLTSGGFKVKYVNVMRTKQIVVVLTWPKELV